MPGHSRCFQNRDGTSNVFLNILKVHHASIVVILSDEQGLFETGGVNVGERVIVSVPATETKVNATNGSKVVVYDHDLFVMRPKLNGICGRLGWASIRLGIPQ